MRVFTTVALFAGLLASLAACGHQGFAGQTETYFYGMRNGGESLYHNLEGGPIAQQRPPPPGDNEGYPNLGSTPARPAPPDIANEQKIADQLAAQRDQAQRVAAANPLVPVAAPPPTPKATAPDPNANKVVMDSAATPPPQPAATQIAATQTPATQTGPAKPAPSPPAAAAAQAIPTLASVPEIPAPVTSGPLPTLAVAPPAAPTGLGDLPTNPSPVKDVEPEQPALPPASSNTVVVDFTYGSATLPPSATLNLRRFALAHKGATFNVAGHGGDVLPGADAQARALDLALRRARALAETLNTAGVPAANLRLRAEAAGRGGVAGL